MREVAYEQIPRAERADKHRRAAEWIESLGRPEDHAEMLAHHYGAALDYARASGHPVAEIGERARSLLVEAGDRAFSLNSFAAAARYYGQALALAPEDAGNQGEVLFRRARALFLAGEPEAQDALDQARVALLGSGDMVRAAEADAVLAELWWHRGNRERSSQHLERAQASVSGRSLMEEAVAHAERLGLGNLARFSRNVHLWLLSREGRWDEALPHVEEFLAACETGQPQYHEGGMRLRRAVVRLARDDADGALEDIQKVVPLAREVGDPQARVPWLSGCARLLAEIGDVEPARARAQEALGGGGAEWALAELALVAKQLGCDEELAEELERGPQTTWTDAVRALLREDPVRAAEIFDEIGDAELEALARLRAAEKLVAEGRRNEADEQLQRSLAFWRSVGATRYVREAEALLAAAS